MAAGGHFADACSLLQLIKALEEARGNGTSMISLIMPPKDQVRQCLMHCSSAQQQQQCPPSVASELLMPPADVYSAGRHAPTLQVARVQKMLGDEFGTASNIKSRVNRQSVLGAITSAQQRLKLYNKVRVNNRWHGPAACKHFD